MPEADGRHRLTTLTDPDALTASLADLTRVYLDAYADPELLAGLEPPEEFLRRYRRDRLAPGVRLVMSTVAGTPAGFGYGILLQADTDWWHSLTNSAMPESFTREDGRRTFAIHAIVVRPPYRRLGHGRAIHRALLHDNPVERSAFMLRPQIAAALALCETLGYLFVGAARPHGTQATFLSMVRPVTDEGTDRPVRRR
ncbi:hypothetical protein ACYF6T_01785 [Streptomyces sp. 7R007]